ncbi:aspartate dehydrogenase [Rhizobium sp. P32RR-XVIII]|uniref:aspartate dehydrogenase n=1 Tax=Rhizobium sp. P32RR-XVIII TaxID=2726738 RepID=UPI0014563DCE|nr:aspartate dehydrogenase [Rhizobium sp. P32RR-XVIII]NLS07690.1 aspartate dehydrogenase [Rhizobium sp. P32RR-XVIII]
MSALNRVRMPLRLCFVGWGAINRRVAELLKERHGDDVVFAAVALADIADAIGVPDSIPVITDPSVLWQLELDLVVEAAGRGAVAQWGEHALRHSGGFVVASASAFCDDGLFERLQKAAREHGSQLIVPPGALAGIDAIAAAAALPLEAVTHRIIKPPRAWAGTAAEQIITLDGVAGPTTFFSGSAREAASRFPQNANVSAVAALSGIGLDRTQVELVADPAAETNRHELAVSGEFGRLNVVIENRPLAANPKSSEMAALSLVRLVENRFVPLVR